MQEKRWLYTRIEAPLALVTLPEEKAELPDIVVSRGWGRWPDAVAAETRRPGGSCERRETGNIFKVSPSTQLHPGSWSRRQTEFMFYTFGYRFEFFPPHAKYLKPLETHDLTINDCAILSI